MAKALFELKEKFRINDTNGDIPDTLYAYLDRFYSSRIGVRTLIGACGAQYVLLYVVKEYRSPGCVRECVSV